MIELESARLILRKLTLSDLDDFYAYRSQPEICRFQGFEPFDRTSAQAFIEKMADAPFRRPGFWCQLGIWSKTQQQLIGDCAIHFLANEPRIVELGITLNARFQGKNFAYEALNLLCDHLFFKEEAHKLKAVLDPRNIKAVSLVKRLGFQKEGHLRKNYFDAIDQDWVDEVIYGKLHSDRCNLP